MMIDATVPDDVLYVAMWQIKNIYLHTVRYRSNVTSYLLKMFVKSRAHVEQAYFSTLTAYRSRNRSHNTKLHHTIQLYR